MSYPSTNFTIINLQVFRNLADRQKDMKTQSGELQGRSSWQSGSRGPDPLATKRVILRFSQIRRENYEAPSTAGSRWGSECRYRPRLLWFTSTFWQKRVLRFGSLQKNFWLYAPNKFNNALASRRLRNANNLVVDVRQYRMSQKKPSHWPLCVKKCSYSCPKFRQMLTDFHNSFTATLSLKFARKTRQ